QTATIELHFVNRIKEGTLSLFLDGQLVWSTPLESPKNPLRRLGGEELIATIAVAAGAHDVEVRVANASARIDAREVVPAELAAGETRRLRVVLVPLRGRLKVKWEP
ncbi:MAG: hypothetical protein NDJ75_09045, partial [Thermoanaerobaculia bacterium]|nr:hypothetical protein [Thermoanaerobaculia bacterium]